MVSTQEGFRDGPANEHKPREFLTGGDALLQAQEEWFKIGGNSHKVPSAPLQVPDVNALPLRLPSGVGIFFRDTKMRIAILSDIHSNIQALTKAFEVLDELGIDEVYCLGDIVGYGGNPNECVDLVRARITKCVLGNHDRAAVHSADADRLERHGRTAALWTQKILTKENREYLLGLPLLETTDLVTLAHAAPGKPGTWERIDSLERAAPHFEHFRTPLCFIGHSHIPFICGEDLSTLEVRSGVRFLVNVGSVGQPRDGDQRLSFGYFDTQSWEYSNIRAEYDIAGAAEAVQAAGLPPQLGERLKRGM